MAWIAQSKGVEMREDQMSKLDRGLVTSASWDTECPRGICNTQADMSFKVFTIFYVF